MKMKKRLLIHLLFCILLLSLPVFSALSAPEVTLRWYLRWDQTRIRNVAEPVKEEYERLNPGVNIVIENIASGDEYWLKLQTMLAANAAPDVIYPATHHAYILSSKNQLLDLMPFVERDNIDLSVYIPAVLDLYKYEDILYALPIDTAALVTFYNKEMFDASGVPYPTDDMTWDEFIAMGKRLVRDTTGDGRINQYAVHLDTDIYWPMLVYHMTGEYLFDDLYQPTEFLLKKQEQINAVQYYADIIVKHGLAPTPSQQAGITDTFLAGVAAMNIVGHWRVPTYNAEAKFEWDVAALPRGKYPANRGEGSGFAVTKDTKHPEAAWQFVNYLAGPDAPGTKKLLELGLMVPSQLPL